MIDDGKKGVMVLRRTHMLKAMMAFRGVRSSAHKEK